MHIGQMLVEAGAITEDQLESALEYQKSLGGHLGHILTKLNYVTEERFVEVLSEQMQKPMDSLADFTPDPAIMGLFPQAMLESNTVIPLRKEMGVIIVGLADPSNFEVIDEMRLHAGMNIETILVPESRIATALQSFYRTTESNSQPSRAQGKRHGLSDLVHELKEDVDRSREQERAENEHWKDMSTRELLHQLTDALIKRGAIAPEDLAPTGSAKTDASQSGGSPL